MTDKEYQEILKKREALGDNWSTLLEEILDDLIEFDNGGSDLYELTEKAFRLRDLLNKEKSVYILWVQVSDQMGINKIQGIYSSYEKAEKAEKKLKMRTAIEEYKIL